MKKLLLCLTLCALCLVGCNNNNQQGKNNNNHNNNNNNNSVVSNENQTPEEEEEEDDEPIVKYEDTDFSKKAGFKVNLTGSLEGVTYDSIFLMNNTTAQLDLIFPDKTIGTLMIDSMGSTHLYDAEEKIYVGDTEVAIQVGADGISVYEWVKDNYAYTYSTTLDLRNSQTLSNLINDVTIEVTEDFRF